MPLGERDEAWKRLHLPPTKAEIQDYVLLKKVQGNSTGNFIPTTCEMFVHVILVVMISVPAISILMAPNCSYCNSCGLADLWNLISMNPSKFILCCVAQTSSVNRYIEKYHFLRWLQPEMQKAQQKLTLKVLNF